MLVSEIQTRVQRLFGDESATFLEAADILNYVNDGQLDIVRKTSCLQAEAAITIVAGTNNYGLAAASITDMLSVKQVTLNYTRLVETDIESNQITASSTFALDIPSGTYALWNDKIYFSGGDVGSVVNCRLFYVKRPAILTLTSQTPAIPVEFHEDLVRFCVARAKEMEEEYGAADRYMGDYGMRVLQARADTDTKNRTSYPAIRCVDDWDY